MWSKTLFLSYCEKEQMEHTNFLLGVGAVWMTISLIFWETFLVAAFMFEIRTNTDVLVGRGMTEDCLLISRNLSFFNEILHPMIEI